ncbi:response regulator [Taibaiella koreensis]|uniref:response regulator n=1 Tax=Taibaiella koreensis TaxID=1268548 RepID=UPI000E59DA81|nr:response regulator transcription factor [Taibaiella koreensis]
MKNIHIAIADDHPMVISGLIALLQPYRHILVLTTHTNAAQLMEGLDYYRPDVLLLDILLPDRSGKDLAPELREKYPDMKILVLTSLDAPSMVTTMMRRGCTGYLLKGAEPETLLEAIETVSEGKEYIDASLKEQLMQNMLHFKQQSQTKGIVPELTQREKEVLGLIAAEYTTREIAEKLFVSYHTAENHRNNLIQKLDVKNTVGLIRVAIQLGLVK